MLFRLKTRIDQELDFYFFFLIIIESYDFRFRPYNFPSPGRSLTHTPKTLNYTAFVEKSFPSTAEKKRSTLYSFFTISNEDQDYEGFETQFYLELKVGVERRF